MTQSNHPRCPRAFCGGGQLVRVQYGIATPSVNARPRVATLFPFPPNDFGLVIPHKRFRTRTYHAGESCDYRRYIMTRDHPRTASTTWDRRKSPETSLRACRQNLEEDAEDEDGRFPDGRPVLRILRRRTFFSCSTKMLFYTECGRLSATGDTPSTCRTHHRLLSYLAPPRSVC